MKKIALGVSNFKELIEDNGYFIDKSLFIREIINDGAKVILLPRPRRFGKTLNMSMLQYFFENTSLSHRYLFDGLAIAQEFNIMKQQGTYPVIYLSFKDAKKTDWASCWEIIKDVIIAEYKRHQYLLDSPILDQQDKGNFQAILKNEASLKTFEASLKNLSTYLHRHHTKRPFILIDEYDSPIHAGFTNNFYSDVIDFMRSFLSPALKDNDDLYKGIMTGILRIAKESVFSGLNNLKVCTLVDNQYADIFGFLESEVKALLTYFKCTKEYNEIKAWYNGYQIGDYQTVYNPWSILNYIDKKEIFKLYWINSSDNLIIQKVIQKGTISLKKDLEQLILGNTIEKEINEAISFPYIFKEVNAAFNFLLFTGYLSFTKVNFVDGIMMASLKIPNKEVLSFYEKIIMSWLENEINIDHYYEMLKELTDGNIELFKILFSDFVFKSMSFFDPEGTEPERFYHALVLGMLVSLGKTHQVLSNRESGGGRYDVMIIPKDLSKIGIIIEFKKSFKDTDEAFETAATEALKQIITKEYATEMHARGITKIISLGIAMWGKKVLIKEHL